MTEETIFHEALAKSPAERAAFLDQACAGQPKLRAAVDALLAAHGASASLLDKPAPASPDATGEFTPEPENGPHATADYQPAIAAGVVIAKRYTLIEKIGEGGMGEVWVAKQTEPVKRKVAIKLIKAGMNSKAVVQRFEQERQALALMDHPNIAKVLDGGLTEDRRPYFVMELVNGLPLTKFCDETKLTTRERLELFVPVCQAVQHAHQKGIVHRDLKPSNILITLYDGKPVPKVIDFGVAKAVAGKLNDESMSTQFGAVVGTLEYMAPEQAGFGAIDIDTRADIYSLGVVLYELLTGLRPFDAKRLRQAALDELIRIIREEEPSKPSTRLSTDESLPSLAASRQTEPRKLMALLRGELDWIVMKCLEKSRDRRYETANALSRDVQRFLADEPVEARPPSAGYRFNKFLRRNKGPVIGTALVMATLVIGVIGTTIGMFHAETQRVRAVEAEADAKTKTEVAIEAGKKTEVQRQLAVAAGNDANTQATIAIEERKSADDRFNLALDAVNKYLSEVTENPKLKEQDFYALRKELLQTAEPFFQKLAKEKPGNSQQAFLQAVALERLAKINTTLGNHAAAEKDLRQALKLLAKVAVEKPNDPEIEAAQSNGLNELAYLVYQLDRFDEAVKLHDETIAFNEKILARAPGDPGLRSNLAASLTMAGITAMAQLRHKDAELYFGRTFEIESELHNEFPKDLSHLQSLAKSHNNFGGVLYHTKGPTKKVIEHMTEAARLQRMVIGIKATETRREDLCRHERNLCMILLAARDFANAQKHAQLGLEEAKSLYTQFPSVPHYRRHVMDCHYWLAQALIATNRPDEAIAEFQKAIGIVKELATNYPMDVDYHRAEAEFRALLANAFRRQSKRREGFDEIDNALKIRRRLATERKATPNDEYALGDTLHRHSWSLVDLNRMEDAIGDLDECIRLFEKQRAQFPNVRKFHEASAIAREDRALTLENMNRSKESLKEYEQALAVHDLLAKRFPTEPKILLHHGQCLGDFAIALTFTGQRVKAGQKYEHAVAILDGLFADGQKDPEFLSVYIRVKQNHGEFLTSEKKLNASTAILEGLLPLCKQLVDSNPKDLEDRELAANCYRNAAEAFRGKKDEKKAYKYVDIAMKEFRSLVQERPDQPGFRLSLATSQFTYATLLLNEKKHKDAAKAFDAAMDILEKIEPAAKNDRRYRQFLRLTSEGRGIARYFLKQYEAAIKDLDRGIDMAPPVDHEDAQYVRVKRALCHVRLGHIPEAVLDVEALTSKAESVTLYNAVCVYALAHAKTKETKYADRAVALLRKTFAMGFRDYEHIKTDSDLESLRERKDFQQIMPQPAKNGGDAKTVHEVAKALTFNGQLNAQATYVTYQFKLTAGKSYVFDMTSKDQNRLDPYLYLRDSTGQILIEDDDGGGGLDARITFRAPKDGIYRIQATSFQATGVGEFVLIIREVTKK